MKIRTYRVAPGRVVIPPKGLVAGPGATNLRFAAGETIEIPADKVDRFIRNRVRLGDLVEVGPETSPARATVKKEG